MTSQQVEPDFDKMGGLIPAIVQHARTGQVLMLGYMNSEAYQLTGSSGQVTFFSRSREKLWTKGETSGNTLQLISMHLDCDQDALLVQALPAGPICHLGTAACFGEGDVKGHFLHQLEAVISSREKRVTGQSYTRELLNQGVVKIAQKVGEEGVETALAAVAQDEAALVNESADLLYHLLVLLRARNQSLEVVLEVLAQRHSDCE